MSIKKLFELDPAEVSLVPKGANKRKFLIWKEDKMPEMPAAAPVAPMISDRAKAAIQAVVRILTPFKGQITDAALDAALDESGVIPMEDGQEKEVGKLGKDEVQDPEAHPKVETNDGVEVAKKKKDAPDMDAEEDDEEDEDDEVEKSDEEDGMSKEESMKSAKAMAQRLMGAKDADEEEKCMKEMKEESKKWFLPIKGEKDMSKKSVVKADGTIDLTAVPVEVRPAVEAIYKSQQELVKKNADLTEALKSERQERRKKDFIAKAAEFKHFTGDRAALATQLMDLEETNKGLYETVVKQLNDVEAQKESVAKSLFSEIGSTMGGSSDVEGKIDAAVAGMVQKSNGELSKAQAYTRFIQSDEGQKLYAEFKAGRKGGI